jgi:hypothetical protein
MALLLLQLTLGFSDAHIQVVTTEFSNRFAHRRSLLQHAMGKSGQGCIWQQLFLHLVFFVSATGTAC